jgi:hypothetical protein
VRATWGLKRVLAPIGARRCRKPPWYAIRMPGGVRGGRREASPYSILLSAPHKDINGQASPAMRPMSSARRELLYLYVVKALRIYPQHRSCPAT